MKLIVLHGCACLAALGAFACASTESEKPSSDAPNTAAVPNTQTKTLASIDVGYGKIQFQKSVASNGEEKLSIVEQASAYATSTPLDKLFSQKNLTSLETFMAIAPDQEPPQELVAAHAAETKNLGRKDTAIVKATFDKDAPVEKAVDACLNFVYAAPSDGCYNWEHKLELQTTNGDWLNVGTYVGDWNLQTGRVAMGVCNATGTATSGQVAWSRDFGDWNYDEWIGIPAYTVQRWFEYNQATSGPDCVGSPICVAVSHPARYGVRQSGGPTDQLLTAYYEWNGLCNPR